MFLSVSHALCAGVACVFLSFTSTFIFYFLFLLSLVSLSRVLTPPASLFHFLLLPPLSSSPLPLPLLPTFLLLLFFLLLLLLPPFSSLLCSLFQLLSLFSSAWLSFPYWTCFNSNSPCPRFTFYLELHNANLLANKIVRSEISCYNETIQEKGAPLIPYDAVLKGEERLWNIRAQGEPVWRWRHT